MGRDFEQSRVLQRALDEEYFKREMGPGLCTYEGPVTEVLAPSTLGAWVMRFPKATNGMANRNVGVRELWAKTRPKIEIWYTSAVANVATFNFRFLALVFGPGVAILPPTTLLVDWSAPGPPNANDILYTSARVTAGVFPSSPTGVARLRAGRLVADANPNDLDILLAVATFEETA